MQHINKRKMLRFYLNGAIKGGKGQSRTGCSRASATGYTHR